MIKTKIINKNPYFNSILEFLFFLIIAYIIVRNKYAIAISKITSYDTKSI